VRSNEKASVAIGKVVLDMVCSSRKAGGLAPAAMLHCNMADIGSSPLAGKHFVHCSII